MAEPMSEQRLQEIREREQAATPGPWRWTGNTDVRQMELSTTLFGRLVVMNFTRWGMSGAQPRFAVGREWKPNPENAYDFTSLGLMTKASELPVFEVAPGATARTDDAVYRADMVGVRHPDAAFIAASRQDMRDLLAEVDRQRQAIAIMGQMLQVESYSIVDALTSRDAEIDRLKAENEQLKGARGGEVFAR